MIIGIVDDDQAVRDSLRFVLEVVGHPVETFASAAEFLATETSLKITPICQPTKRGRVRGLATFDLS